MAATTTVKNIIDQRVKVVLQELAPDGIRWTNAELLCWLNESYQVIVGLRPDSAAVNESIELKAGTKQIIPDKGMRLLDVVRNLSESGMAILVCDRRQLDMTVRNWHGEKESDEIEHFVFDEMDPRHFYVYPPAAEGTRVEIIYSAVPPPHGDYETSKGDVIRLDDSYAPAIVDYILYRAFAKDADFAGNANRSAMHYNAFNTQLGGKGRMDMSGSPNAGGVARTA